MSTFIRVDTVYINLDAVDRIEIEEEAAGTITAARVYFSQGGNLHLVGKAAANLVDKINASGVLRSG